MIYFILITLLVVFFFEYKFQKCIIAPFSIFLLSFIGAVFLISLNVENWEVSLNDAFVIYIFTAIISFGLACFLTESLFCFSKYKLYDDKHYNTRVLMHSKNDYPINFLFLISMLCTFIYTYHLISSVGFTSDVTLLLRSIYDAPKERNFLITQTREIVVAIAEISVFEILLLKYIHNIIKIKKRIYIPIILGVVLSLISTDRNILLRFIFFSSCLYSIFIINRNMLKNKSINWRLLKKAFAYSFIFIGIFFAFGKLKGYTSNLERMVGIYGGSGLYNFNLFLESFNENNLRYGDETFSTLLNMIEYVTSFGDHIIPYVGELGLIVFRASNGYVYASNIYSAMCPYVIDFGFWGILFYPFLLGVIFEFLFILVKKNKFGISWLLYSYFCYSLFYFTIAEQFFIRFHLGMIYEIFWLFILFFLSYRKLKICVSC